MINIRGLDKLQKELDDLQNFLSNLDGELGSVRFDPHDPSSIESAIQSANRMIDDKAGAYVNSDLALSLLDNFKDSFRKSILKMAMEARLTREDEE